MNHHHDTESGDIECDVAVIGAGPGGYSAAFRCADLGMKTVLIERYPTLGGVCLNVGCIPSKALLHMTSVLREAHSLAAQGIEFGDARIDVDKLRAYKDGVVRKLTRGLAGLSKMRKVDVMQGAATFESPHGIAVALEDGSRQRVAFKKAIIATGSSPMRLPLLPEDPRVIDSTGALRLPAVGKRMLVIGGGIIGMEMATVYSALGTRIDVVEMSDGLMPGTDRDLVRTWAELNAPRFAKVMLGTRCTGAEASPGGILVRLEGENAPLEPQLYDLVLVAVGRTPNGRHIGAEYAGVEVDERGFIHVDQQMRTNVEHIFAIGDVVGQPMLAHKAVHEAHVAAEAACGSQASFVPKQIPSVAYTDPEIAWTGKTEAQCKAEGIAYTRAIFPWAASGRAIANGRDEGFTKLLVERSTQRIIGGGIVGQHAGDLIGEVCLAVEMGCLPPDVGKTIHPHPTLCETIGMAAEVLSGVCTDLPPAR